MKLAIYILHRCESVLQFLFWLTVKILLECKIVGRNCLKILSPAIVVVELIVDSQVV